MKRLVSACLLLAFVAFGANAEDLKIKRVALPLNEAPPGTQWSIQNGIRVVGKGAKVILEADTAETGLTGTAAWTLTAPGGSTAALDNASAFRVSFTADVNGFYYLTLAYGGKNAADTIYASTYTGVGSDATAGCFCHPTTAPQIKTDWAKTGHAQIFKQGITGNLENEIDPTTGTSFGAYAPTCIKCHVTGWDPALANNNFGYSVKQTGWDTTWYKGLPFQNGDYWVQKDDMSKWNALTAEQQSLGTIGCESCHGPSAGHKTMPTKQTIARPKNAGVCNQCHNGSGRHSIGTWYNLSVHAKVPTATEGEGGRSNCQPCHTGDGFLYWIDHNKDTAGIAAAWMLKVNANSQISCQVCHDPHKAATINADGTLDAGLRKVSVDSLRNGFKFTPAGASQVCSYCHSSRYSVKLRVTNQAPYYGFTNRFGPHENPQMDMLVGGNGYHFGDTTFAGLNTHGGLEDGCVTCHMQGRTRSGNTLANHSMHMTGDTAYGFKATKVCGECHGEIEDFNDVRAFYDYDRNGRIEGVQTEIQGLLNKLKATLPLDASGEPVTMTADSLKVKNHPEYVGAIWNYYLVKNDGSMGIHNTKYAVRLLYKALGWTPLTTSVKPLAGPSPADYRLDQNYPNPFNPSTVIRFGVPKDDHVKLEVYDITGALVKTLINQTMRKGNVEVQWDGTNNSGAKVAAGMYIYRLQAGANFVTAKKMLMVK